MECETALLPDLAFELKRELLRGRLPSVCEKGLQADGEIGAKEKAASRRADVAAAWGTPGSHLS